MCFYKPWIKIVYVYQNMCVKVCICVDIYVHVCIYADVCVYIHTQKNLILEQYRGWGADLCRVKHLILTP